MPFSDAGGTKPWRLTWLSFTVRFATTGRGSGAARFIESACLARGHRVDSDRSGRSTGCRSSIGCTRNISQGRHLRSSRTLAGLIKAADAFIIVSGEYNHSIPPALSNLLDHFLEEYFWRPSAIVCYSAGAFGGVRAAMQLRAMLCELGTPSIPSLLPVPNVQDAFDENGHPLDELSIAVPSGFSTSWNGTRTL